MRRFALASAIILILSAASTAAADNLSDCKTTGWSDDTTYYLTQNISNRNDHCMLIGSASGVTLDCQGYTIDGDGDGDGTGIYAYMSDSITIKNCIVNEFGVGVAVYGSDDVVIEDVGSDDHAWMSLYGYDSNNVQVRSSASGVSWFSDSNAGIYIDDACTGWTVGGSSTTGVDVDGNDGLGIYYLSSGSSSDVNYITHNWIAGNTSGGILVDESADYVEFSNNDLDATSPWYPGKTQYDHADCDALVGSHVDFDDGSATGNDWADYNNAWYGCSDEDLDLDQATPFSPESRIS